MNATAAKPRLTVGLPTYNRFERLPRTVASLLGQTFTDFELVISDNASTDATPELCARLAATDSRIRIVRHAANLGLTANFNSVLSAGRGDLVMVVADDDWLDADYLERCVAFLDDHPGHVLVSGAAQYHDGDQARGGGVDVDCEQDDPAARVRWFFAHVVDNASIYGVMRRPVLERALPMPNALAGDWMLIGRLLMSGRLHTITETAVHRSVGGTSASFARTARSMGLTALEARHPHLAMGRLIYRDIATGSPAYGSLTLRQRRMLARACAGAVLRARPLNVIDDALAPLLSRPRLQRIDRTIRRAVRGDSDQPYLP
ncbi:MAG: hypothetical protein JWO02_199 [Solirubrobacterales bacterium]|nr:hypothetical protein [Solirubrobacterales bacterium]